MHKKLLIVQFRTDASCAHEQQCLREDFPDFLDKLVFVNAVTGSLPQELGSYAGVILGGSGEFMLGEAAGEGTWRYTSFDFIQRVLDAHIPMLGICFGMQILALSQGARIVNDERMQESGSFKVYVNNEGISDPLFENLPATFFAQFGHKETIVDAPDTFISLAHTDRVDMNTFRIQGKRAWGIIMHPELTPKRVAWRLGLFPNYLGNKTIEEIAEDFHPSPYATQLLRNFVESVFE